MTLGDLVDILSASRERIDVYWNFYAVVAIAVVGWLVSVRRTLTRPMKALVTVAYVVRRGMTLAGLYGAPAARSARLRHAAMVGTPDPPCRRSHVLLVLWRAPFSERHQAAV